MPRFGDLGSLIGRILIAAYFVLVGWRRVKDVEISVASNIERGLPVPEVLSVISFVVPVGAGLLLLFGLKTVAAALLLIAFTPCGRRCITTSGTCRMRPICASGLPSSGTSP